MHKKLDQSVVDQGFVRIQDKVTSQYKAVVFSVKLKTGEVIDCLKHENAFWELERKVLTELENGQLLMQCYVSSFAIPENLMFHYNEDLQDSRKYIHPKYECVVENAAIYMQDPLNTPISLGAHPYYLIIYR